MTYDEFLRKHENLTANCVAAEAQYKHAEDNYKDAQENQAYAQRSYDAATEQDRPKLQNDLDASTARLQTSSDDLHESRVRRDDALDERSQFESAHKDF